MNKVIIALIAVLGLTYASAGNFSVTAGYLGGDAFLAGAQGAVAVSDSTDLTLDVGTNFTDVDVLFGVRQYVWDFDTGERGYVTARAGVGNPLNSLISAPDTYSLGLGLGAIEQGNLIEGNVYVQNDTSTGFGFGFAIVAGIGLGW